MDELTNFINDLKSHYEDENTTEEFKEYDLNLMEKLDDINNKYKSFEDELKVSKEEYDKVVYERDNYLKKYIERFGQKSTSESLRKKSFDDIINENISI